MFNFSIQLLMVVPGASIDTLIELMQQPKGLPDFKKFLPKLDPDASLFFNVKYDSKELEQTKSQVVDRLFAIKRIRTLSRMFSAKKTQLDLYTEMGKGRVILINCAKSLLQEEGVEIVSRFFLAMILLAAEKRQLLPAVQRLPAYVYIDECQDVIRRDEKLPIILDQARKFRVGMILAHQRLEQMQPHVLSALGGSTAIKFAAKLSDNTLARQMNTTAEFIRDQPNFSYAAYIRGQTPKAISLSIPLVDMNKFPRMSAKDSEAIRDGMRKRYALSIGAPVPEADPSQFGVGSTQFSVPLAEAAEDQAPFTTDPDSAEVSPKPRRPRKD